MISLEGKFALITGASQGIGRAIAVKLAQAGADIIGVDLNEDGLKSLKSEIEGLGKKCITKMLNVSKLDNVSEIIKSIHEEAGHIDILVNNAGITKDTLILRMKEEDWDAVLNVNLKGSFNVIKSCLPIMMKQKSGKIVNIASIVGITGNAGQANYSASKSGLIALTKSTAKEAASRGINVNAVAPGFINTAMTAKLPDEVKSKYMEMIPFKKYGEPEDVANAVLYLSSDLSSYITGQVLLVDGGMVM